MLTDVEIESFQSLKRLSLKLGKFTVVTGATGSGKSAVLRALELLAFNARGTSYITRGEKTCKVTVGGHDEDGWGARIERGASRGKDCYRLHSGPVLRENPGKVFTKLGGEVPPDVSRRLQLSELNFARQFGLPFLLDSSGGEIARVLGRLTNVTLLFDAAREANRRRLEVMGDLRRAEANLASLTEAAQRFRGMHERRQAVTEAEEALQRSGEASVALGRLRALTGRLEAAEGALERTAPPQVPDGGRLTELAGRLARLRELLQAFRGGQVNAENARDLAEEAVQDEEKAHYRLHEVLVAAGQCPTCGSVVA